MELLDGERQSGQDVRSSNGARASRRHRRVGLLVWKKRRARSRPRDRARLRTPIAPRRPSGPGPDAPRTPRDTRQVTGALEVPSRPPSLDSSTDLLTDSARAPSSLLAAPNNSHGCAGGREHRQDFPRPRRSGQDARGRYRRRDDHERRRDDPEAPRGRAPRGEGAISPRSSSRGTARAFFHARRQLSDRSRVFKSLPAAPPPPPHVSSSLTATPPLPSTLRFSWSSRISRTARWATARRPS
jgi:hypothetical protein